MRSPFSLLLLLILVAPVWSQEDEATVQTGLQAALALEQAMVSAIAKAENSVVAIARGRKDNGDFARLRNPDFIPKEYATGVIVDRNGLILTNYHALGDISNSDYAVWIRGRVYTSVHIKAADPWSDLAVLEIDAKDLTPITLGDATTLKKGRLVIALGNPYAIARDGNVSATWGIVSNIGRKVDGPLSNEQLRVVNGSDKETMHHFGGLIQTDARLSLGTSGGPLLNLQGEMVGLTTSLAALAGYERSAGYALPVDESFRHALDRLKRGQEVEYGFLGVEPRNQDLRDESTGVELGTVAPGTPAVRSGLQEADVITRIDGKPVRTTDDLFLHIGSQPVDHVAEIVVRRGRRQITTKVELSKKYIQASRPTIASAPRTTWRGMQVDYATALPSVRGMDADPDGCVAVIDVELDSPAWKSGIRPGVFISHVEGQRVAKPAEFHKLVEDRRDDAVQLRFTTQIGGDLTRTVEPELVPFQTERR